MLKKEKQPEFVIEQLRDRIKRLQNQSSHQTYMSLLKELIEIKESFDLLEKNFLLLYKKNQQYELLIGDLDVVDFYKNLDKNLDKK